MLVKEIEYIDYNGTTRKEKFYFNLTKAEAMEWNLSAEGGLEEYIAKITAEQDGKRLVEIFKELILKTYGEKSLDGKHFIKNQDLRDKFSQTEAYSELFVELATNADSAVAFINGIAPKVDNTIVKK
jgi:hypothetical protein